MNKPSELVECRTTLKVYSKDRDLTYVFPAVGPSNYRNVGKQILEASLQVPTGDDTASFVRDLYLGDNKDKKVIADARGIVRDRWLWVYQNNLWTPEGFFSVKDRNAEGLSQKLKIKDLRQKLVGGSTRQGVEFSSDREVSFAPRGSYAFGEMSADRLALDGAIIAQYGLEGAKLLADAASSLRNKPITYGLDIEEGQDSVQRASALYVFDGRLHFVGNAFGGDGGSGCAFPISASNSK